MKQLILILIVSGVQRFGPSTLSLGFNERWDSFANVNPESPTPSKKKKNKQTTSLQIEINSTLLFRCVNCDWSGGVESEK